MQQRYPAILLCNDSIRTLHEVSAATRPKSGSSFRNNVTERVRAVTKSTQTLHEVSAATRRLDYWHDSRNVA